MDTINIELRNKRRRELAEIMEVQVSNIERALEVLKGTVQALKDEELGESEANGT